MASILNLLYLIPALGLLAEFVRLRNQTPVDEQAGMTAFEDRCLVGAIFGATLPALLSGSLLVMVGVLAVIGAEAYVLLDTDRSGMALLPTPGFRSRNISAHQNMVLGLGAGGLFAGFIGSLIFGAIVELIIG